MGKGKKRRSELESNPKLDPEQRIAPEFDSTSIKKFDAPECGKMGFRVLDNCAEEHEM